MTTSTISSEESGSWSARDTASSMHHPDADVSIDLYLMISPLDPQEDANKRFNRGLFNHVRGGVHDLTMAFIDHWTDYGTDAHISDEGTTQ